MLYADAMTALLGLGLPFIPPAALVILGLGLGGHAAARRWVGTLLLAVGMIGLLLVAAVEAWFLSTFDPS